NAKSMAWFSDPANRAEAIKIMVEASKLKQDDVAKSYDFLHKNGFFETTGKLSKTKMGALLNALKGLGDVEGSVNIERFVLVGVTAVSARLEQRRGGGGRAGTAIAPGLGDPVAAPLPGGRRFGSGRTAAVGAGEPLSRRQRALSRRPLADLHGDSGAR